MEAHDAKASGATLSRFRVFAAWLVGTLIGGCLILAIAVVKGAEWHKAIVLSFLGGGVFTGIIAYQLSALGVGKPKD